jgi:hypothetical protein
MILPISTIERIEFFKSLGPYSISDEILKKLANNRNIYFNADSPVSRLIFIKDNKLLEIPHVCKLYDYYHDINQPFMVYQLYDNYLRGFFVDDYINEFHYKQYLIKSGSHRDKLISEILDSI